MAEITQSLRERSSNTPVVGTEKSAGMLMHIIFVDNFEHQGPNGTHVCLRFELIGMTLRSFGA